MTAMQRRVIFTAFLAAALALAQAADRRDRDFWNQKFSDPKTEFRWLPSPLLVDAIHSSVPGRALDLGMGEGRNTIFLAQQGWNATGVDLSDVAIAQAKERAEQVGVKITAVVDDLDHFPMGENQWDLIAMFYVHAWYREARPKSTERVAAALKPGGLLVVEGFAGKDKFLFRPNELLRDFPGLRVVRYEDLEGEAEWALGRSHIIRFVAEKPKP
jgi:SAM-dependent methyltransferase